MQTMGAFEAKTHFSGLLEQVEKGEQIIITKHGHPIAKLVPISNMDRETVRMTIEKIRAFQQGNTLNGIDWKSLRDEGRK
jgi:prevent-host-death family protein